MGAEAYLSNKLFLNRFVDQIAGKKYAGFYISLAGVLLAVAFTFLLYPRISSPLDISLDPDAYGRLAHGIQKNGSFSYFPCTEPSIRRGPLYPAFIWLILALQEDWYPYSVQAVQCLLFGLTVLIIFGISDLLWNRRTAVWCSIACCMNPFLIWFTSRIWAEVLLFFLFTLLAASLVYLTQRPSAKGSVLVGSVLGLLVLCKQTFLPFILLLPILFLLISGSIKLRHSICVMGIALLLVVPWTMRNWHLTGLFLPVHTSAGVQIQVGDKHLGNFKDLSSLTYEEGPMVEDEVNAGIPKMPSHLTQAQKDALGDAFLMKRSLLRYIESPVFFLKKLPMNALMFWFSGSTVTKTLWIALFQLPILIFFIICCVKIVNLRMLKTVHGILITMVWAYFLLHLPFFAVARYSSVLVPVMTMYAVGCFLMTVKEGARGWQGKPRSDSSRQGIL